MKHLLRPLVLAGLAIVLASCAARTQSSSNLAATPALSGTTLIPTRYSADRFFAIAVLPRGDTATVFLDTAGGTLVWESYLSWLGLSVDSVAGNNGKKFAVATYPQFRDAAAFPPAVVRTPAGTGLRVSSVTPTSFAAWISRTTQAQFGATWFGGRIWTWDYPHHQLLLHQTAPLPAKTAHHIPLMFNNSIPIVDVVIDQDTLTMMLDTGATLWLSADALTAIDDGGPSERSTSHVQSWIFARWKQRHPDWRIIEKADLWSGASLIQVPRISIAGFEVGPLWFSVLPGPDTPPPAKPDTPDMWKRFGGTLGGSALKSFQVTLNYPEATATFVRN